MRRLVIPLIGAAAVAMAAVGLTAASQAATPGPAATGTAMPGMSGMPSASGSTTAQDSQNPSQNPSGQNTGNSQNPADYRLPPGTRLTTLRYGPIHLGKGSMADGSETYSEFFGVQKPCSACQLVLAIPNLVYADGSEANMDNGPMLHHFVLYNATGRDTVCHGPFDIYGQRLLASGNERTVFAGPVGYGMNVRAADYWNILYDLMNYAPTEKQVYVQVVWGFVPGTPLKPVVPVWLDETGCPGISAYPVPKGPSHQSYTWTSTISGDVIGAGGHLHPYGVNVVATDSTTGKTICDSVATDSQMGGMSAVTGMTKCIGNPSVAHIDAGDKIRLDTYYDTPAVKFEVMGIMLLYVSPDGATSS